MRNRKKTKRRLNFPEKINFPAAAMPMPETNPVASEEKKDAPIIENKVETPPLHVSTEYDPEIDTPYLEASSSQLPSTEYDTEEYIEEKAPESFSSIMEKTIEEMTKSGKTVDELFEVPSLSPAHEATPPRSPSPTPSSSSSSSASLNPLPVPPPRIIPPRSSFLQEAQGALRAITANQLIPSKISTGLGILSAGALTLLGVPVIPALLMATAVSVANETALAFRRNLAAIFLKRDKLENRNSDLHTTVEEILAKNAGKLANNSTPDYVADIFRHPYSCNPWSQLGRAYQIGRAKADEKAAKIVEDTAKKKSCCL